MGKAAQAENPIIVIGAGIGGLTAAALLAARGEKLLVVEQADAPGGKIATRDVGGQVIECGPSVFTMKPLFDSLFAEAGADLDAELSLAPAQLLARHAWSRAERLDLHWDLEATASAIADFAGAREADGYRAFCAEAERIYRTLERPFLQASRPNPLSLSWRIGLKRLPDLFAINPYQSLWAALGRHFKDQRLRQLFGRYSTYCGSSPFRAPATLMLIAHVERCGVWLIAGGMQRLPQALERVAKRNGAEFRYGEGCAEIVVEHGRVAGVLLASGEPVAAKSVIFNGDASALGAGFLGEHGAEALRKLAPARRSLSAAVWLVSGEASGFDLVRHNIFFSNDYRTEFEDIAQGRLPGRPTAYVCAQDRGAHEPRGPPGAERMQIIVNAPPIGDERIFGTAEMEACRERIWEHLEVCGLRIDPQAMATLTPQGLAGRFPGSGGALYGRASHGWASSFLRPGSRTRLPGLYLAGGTTHPGAGVPMAALSGRLAAHSLLADRASTER